MKVLTVYHYGILGGVVAQLRHRLDALGDRVEMHLGFIEDHGAASAFPGHRHLHFFPRLEGLTELLRREAFDVIVNIDTPAAYPAIQAAETEAPILHEVHTAYTFLVYLWALVDKPPMSALLTPSAYLRDRLLYEFGFDGVRPVHVVPNALNTEMFAYREPAWAPARPVFLWIGKLDDHKNWRDFLRIAAEIKARMAAAFWMVGGYTAAEAVAKSLLEEAARLGVLDELRWIQRADYEAMPALYSLAARSGGALVSTSTDESFGMVAAEAMACRCPVVAARVGALPEVLEGPLAAGFYRLGEVGRAAEIAVGLSRDAEQRRTLQDAGERRVAEQYSLQRVAERYLGMLESLVQGPRAAAEPAGAGLAMAEPAADERERAEAFWATDPVKDFYFRGKESVRRSRWLAEEVLSRYEFGSILEPGCNCGRNLFYALERYPGIEAAGFDVNEQAIAFAREHVPGAAFEVRSMHDTGDIPDDRYDVVFTMSVLDHVPEVEAICREFLRIARRAVILVEVDTGTEGKCVEPLKQKGVDNFCYSRHYGRLFESLGARVTRYEPVAEHFPETFMGPYYWLLEAGPPTERLDG